MKKSHFFVSSILIVFITIGAVFIHQFVRMPEQDHIQISLFSDPYPMSVGPMNLIVSVADSRNSPTENADVYAITQETHHSHNAPPIRYPVQRYENGYYYIPIIWSMVGQASVTIHVAHSDRTVLAEEFLVYVYGIPPINLENQRYHSQSEIQAELTSAPDNEFWIVVPQGAQESATTHDHDFIPSVINLSVSGQNTLVIRNDDLVDNNIGPFYVRAGETLRQRFDAPGIYQGTCTFNQGIVRIEVSD